MKVVWLLTAQDHIELIYEFLAQKSQRAASELYNLIISEVDKLAIFPEMAPIEPSLCNESLSYRSLIVSKTYKVIYRVDYENERLVVVAVWDCRQEPEVLQTKI